MDRVQHNGGTAGIVAGVLLALLFVIILSLGMDVMAPDDPAKSLGAVTQRWSRWVLASVIGLLVSGIAVPFTVGIATRLRDAAPTRARTVLYVTLIGLGGFAAGSVVMWLGGAQVVAYAAKDQAAAAQAWLTLSAVNSGFSGLGGAFTGAGTLIAGWAIISTGVMGSGVGWVGIISGALNILGLFAPTNPLFFFGGFLSTIVWLLWAGTELRRAKPSM